MKKPVLLLPLIALSALGLVACGGGEGQTTAASEAGGETVAANESNAEVGKYESPLTGKEPRPARKSCGQFRTAPPGQYPAIRVEVVEGDAS